MAIGRPGTPRFLILLVTIPFLWLVVLMAGIPQEAFAEGNEPTVTPTVTITVTLPPTDTPIPTSEQPQDDTAGQDQDISKELPASETGNITPTSPGQNAPKSLTSSIGRTNLCLIGGIVVATIFVMVIVVYGVIRRVGQQES